MKKKKKQNQIDQKSIQLISISITNQAGKKHIIHFFALNKSELVETYPEIGNKYDWIAIATSSQYIS